MSFKSLTEGGQRHARRLTNRACVVGDGETVDEFEVCDEAVQDEVLGAVRRV